MFTILRLIFTIIRCTVGFTLGLLYGVCFKYNKF